MDSNWIFLVFLIAVVGVVGTTLLNALRGYRVTREAVSSYIAVIGVMFFIGVMIVAVGTYVLRIFG